jgi:hypothetical protein
MSCQAAGARFSPCDWRRAVAKSCGAKLWSCPGSPSPVVASVGGWIPRSVRDLTGTPLASGDECGIPDTFSLEVGISSSYHIAKFWGLTGLSKKLLRRSLAAPCPRLIKSTIRTSRPPPFVVLWVARQRGDAANHTADLDAESEQYRCVAVYRSTVGEHSKEFYRADHSMAAGCTARRSRSAHAHACDLVLWEGGICDTTSCRLPP